MASFPRIVIDTNIWLSALYFSGKPAKIVRLVEDQKLISITSSFILKELQDKMTIDFSTPSFAANAIIDYIGSMSEAVPLKGIYFNLRDPADNYVLETAVAGKCDYLVTGDRDLLDVKKHNKIQIVNAKEILDMHLLSTVV
jgi:uncharacterized protein